MSYVKNHRKLGDFENVVLKKLRFYCTGKSDSNILTHAGCVDSKTLVRLALLKGMLLRLLYTYQNELIICDRISSTLQHLNIKWK